MAPHQALETPKRSAQSGLLWPIQGCSLANVPEQVSQPGAGSGQTVVRGRRRSFWDSFWPAFFSLAFFSSSSFLFLSLTLSASLNRSKGSASSSRRFPNLFATEQPKASGSIVTYGATQTVTSNNCVVRTNNANKPPGANLAWLWANHPQVAASWPR